MDDYIQERTENNAWLIYRADFYPIYTQRIWKGLCAEELIILSFVYYWTKNWNYVFATNEDLAELVWATSRTVKKFVKKLIELWLIECISKTIVWMGTDRRMKYTGGEKISLPLECASEAESTGGEKISLPKKGSKEANSTGGAKNALPWKGNKNIGTTLDNDRKTKENVHMFGSAKNALPWEENKFVGSTCDNSGKCQENGNPSEVQNLHPYKNNIKEYYFTDKISDEILPPQSDDKNKTELVQSDNKFMFNDGSIEYYTNLALQQTNLKDVVNILRPLFPHFVGYKWSKKEVEKALKQFQLNHDFIYNLVYDMKLLARCVEAKITKRQWFMHQRIDGYVPYTESQRDELILKIVTFIKRNNKDKELFEKRAHSIANLIGVDKYRKVFRSIPANPEDRVDLSGMY